MKTLDLWGGRSFSIPFAAEASGGDGLDPKDRSVAHASEVGAEAQRALKKANESGLSGLKLEKAVLTMETGTIRAGGIHLSFLIFTVSSRRKKGHTVTTTMEFVVPKPGRRVKKLDPEQLTDSLAKAIAHAARVASKIDVLSLHQSTITLEFVVEKEVGGGLSFKVLGVDIGGDVSFKKTSRNSLEVKFSL